MKHQVLLTSPLFEHFTETKLVGYVFLPYIRILLFQTLYKQLKTHKHTYIYIIHIYIYNESNYLPSSNLRSTSKIHPFSVKKSSTSRPGLQVLWPVVTFLANGPCEAKEYSVTAAWASYLKGPVSDDYW